MLVKRKGLSVWPHWKDWQWDLETFLNVNIMRVEFKWKLGHIHICSLCPPSLQAHHLSSMYFLESHLISGTFFSSLIVKGMGKSVFVEYTVPIREVMCIKTLWKQLGCKFTHRNFVTILLTVWKLSFILFKYVCMATPLLLQRSYCVTLAKIWLPHGNCSLGLCLIKKFLDLLFCSHSCI